MDSLDTLPLEENEKDLAPQQQQLMDKYLGAPAGESGSKDGEKWKYIGYAVIAFLLLSNPWVQDLLNKAPYLGGNNLKVLALTTVIFAVLMMIINFFL